MIEAVLRVSLPCSWITDLTAHQGVMIDIVEQKAAVSGRLHTLAEIDPGEADPAAVVERLRANPYIADLETIVPPKGRILVTMQVRDCHACSTLATSECFLKDATATEEGGLAWRIIAPNRRAVEDLMHDLRRRGIRIEIAAIKTAKRGGSLTDRQDQVLGLAYKLGYFEFPKRINLTDLAKKLGVAKSTLSEILRTGEEKILHVYFQGLMKGSR